MKKENRKITIIVSIIILVLIITLNILQFINKDEVNETLLYRIEIESFAQMNNNMGMYVEKECDRNFTLNVSELQIVYNRQPEQHINIYKIEYKNPIQRLFFDAGVKAEIYLQYSEMTNMKGENNND